MQATNISLSCDTQPLQLMKLHFFYLPGREYYGLSAFTILALLIFMTSDAGAQNRMGDDGYALALSTGYDTPVGNLAYTFKPAQTYEFTGMQYKSGFTASFTLGYHAYKPKQDTFYYAIDSKNYGTTVYQNFTITTFYLGTAYNLKLSDDLTAYGGINFGIWYSHMVYDAVGIAYGSDADLHEECLYFAPKAGINYLIGDHLAIGLEGKYNSFAPTGEKAYNDLVGTIYSSYAATFFLTYNF